MSDQQRCPECDGYGWSYAHGGGDEPEREQCRACHGTGKVLPEKLADTVPGQESLPADLIDRAVDTLDAYVPFTPGARSEMGLAVCDLAPLLVEHGAERERVKWEARIEAAAAEHDEQAEWYEQRAANEKPTSGRGQRYVKSLREDAESERARAARFRSLLTGEGDGE